MELFGFGEKKLLSGRLGEFIRSQCALDESLLYKVKTPTEFICSQ